MEAQSEGRTRAALGPGFGRACLREAVDEVAPLFDEMRAGLARIREVVATLGCFAEDVGQGGGTAEVDLNLEVRRVLLLLQGSGLRSLPIETQLDPLPSLSLPVLGLRQLLLDLVGRLLRIARVPGGLRIRTIPREPGVCLEVEDREVVLDGAELRALFETDAADPEAPAGRLRLRASREAAGRMGVVMSAELVEPKGLCVRLLFPSCGACMPRVAATVRA